jgi:DNA-binding NarL/FixJ family response regulator
MESKEAKPSRRAARVLIVDDCPVVREGLASRIAKEVDLVVCGEAADCAQALQLLADAAPDVVVTDLSLKTVNGLSLVKRIRARAVAPPVLVWSIFPDSLYAERAVRAGAMGYVNKAEPTHKILEAVRCVLGGKVYLSEAMADQILRRAVGRSGAVCDPAPIDELSDRELEVFRLIGHGLDTGDIARTLCVSAKTVETYRARIKDKLRLGSSLELLRRAFQWTMEPTP